MRFRPTPRLCAQCGKEILADEAHVVLEDATSGEQQHLHRACFERAYEPLESEQAASDEPHHSS
jgi:hypothetical protein